MSSHGIEILLSLLTALVAGILIGAEREQGDRKAVFAGVRTFPLFALAGAIGMLVSPWLLIAHGVGVAVMIGVAYVRGSSLSRPRIGTSTEMAAVVTFGLGALCTARELPLSVEDRLLLVGAGASMVMGLLSLKRPITSFLSKVSSEDVYATAKLLLLAVIVLPALPNQDLGPWGSLNPRQIGLLVVLVSAIGFAGYVAIRAAGPMRGLELTGLLGGFASSTAVTLSFADKAKYSPKLVNPCALAIILASSTMFPRMLLYVSAVSPSLGRAASIPFVAAAVTGLVAAYILHRRHVRYLSARDSAPPQSLQFTNPFSLSKAVRFAALLTLVSLLSNGAAVHFKNAGAYVAALMAGTVSVDALTLSIAKLHSRAFITRHAAVDAIGLAALSNTVVKVIFAWFLGGRALGVRVAGVLFLCLVVGFGTRVFMLSYLGW